MAKMAHFGYMTGVGRLNSGDGSGFQPGAVSQNFPQNVNAPRGSKVGYRSQLELPWVAREQHRHSKVGCLRLVLGLY